MNKYFCEREITQANGQQLFMVEADSEKEAKEKFKNGEGVFQEEELNAEGLGPYDLDNLWIEE